MKKRSDDMLLALIPITVLFAVLFWIAYIAHKG